MLPALRLTADDVFYDLGSGTGKIPLQVALQSPCKSAVGIEFVHARHAIGQAALARLRAMAEGGDALLARRHTQILSALDRTRLVEGDVCDPAVPLEDATAIFINNTVFQPDLMARIVERLARLPHLRVVCSCPLLLPPVCACVRALCKLSPLSPPAGDVAAHLCTAPGHDMWPQGRALLCLRAPKGCEW